MKRNPTQSIKMWTQVFSVLISCLTLFSIAAQAHIVPTDTTVTLNYSFKNPTITPIDIAGTTYTRITIPDCYPGGSAGEPKIPSKGAYILLPPKTTLSSIDVTP